MGCQALFFGVCRYTGLLKLARWWMQRRGQSLIILNYHRASVGDLRRHLLYLRRHYRMMHLEEALEELYTPHERQEQVRDRRTPLVLTFDDGFLDNYTLVLPLACELKVPITIFLIQGYIESGNCFWWLEGERLTRHAQVDKVVIEGCIYHLNQREEREALVQAIYTFTCHARSVAEREAFLAMVREALGVNSQVSGEERTVLNWAEIREMEESGWISFGAHTVHHPVLAYLSDATEVQREVSESRTMLEQSLGHPVRTFAYPLGRSEHIGEEGLRAVRKAGYDWAVTTIYGFNTPESDPLQLRRIVADTRLHWLLVAADTSGLRKLFFPFFSFGRKLITMGAMAMSTPLAFLRLEYRKVRGEMQ